MQTVCTDSPEEAASFLRRGHLVAFPTETVYGLGASIEHPEAVAAVFDVKGRPTDNPTIVHVSSIDAVRPLAASLSDAALTLMQRFFPGPLTIVVRRSPRVPDVVTAGRDTVAVRMPDHALALDFLRRCGVAVAAPSANRSGRPSPTRWEDVEQDLGGRIACILRGEPSRVGVESTVVDCMEDPALLLRAGGVSLEALRAAGVAVRLATPGELERGRSPGTRYRHYAPSARVRVVDTGDQDASPQAGYIGLDAPRPGPWGDVLVAASPEDYAHHLFAFFRQCDAHGLQTILCQSVPRLGVGRAIMDRLERAAEPEPDKL